MASSGVTPQHKNHMNSDKMLREITGTDSRRKLRNDSTEAGLHSGMPMGNAYLIETL